MARTTRFDELNNVSTTQVDERAVSSQIERYFEEMDLEQYEIEERISLAKDFEKFFRNLFLLMLGGSVIENRFGQPTLESQRDYYSDYAYRGYTDTLQSHGYGDYISDADTFLSQYAKETTSQIVDTTILYIADSYYTSIDRSIFCSENETNAVANYQKNVEAIKAGYTKKTWITKHDARVRKTHVVVDNHTIGIYDAFDVGDSQMLFPNDSSLGASPREIIRCRCVCKYSGRES